MHVARPVLGLIATIALTVGGCGDDGGSDSDDGEQGGSCESFVACGGDIVGTWTFTGGCAMFPSNLAPYIDDDSPIAECVNEVIPKIDADIAGTTTFRADGTYSVDQTTMVRSSFSVSKACLERAANAEVDCAALGAETSGARCVLREAPVRSMNASTGMYMTSNNQLWMAPADVTSRDEPVEFCVRGDTLTARLAMADGLYLQWAARKQ
jgi:hypothetical protein